jgi:hypothetical protein
MGDVCRGAPGVQKCGSGSDPLDGSVQCNIAQRRTHVCVPKDSTAPHGSAIRQILTSDLPSPHHLLHVFSNTSKRVLPPLRTTGVVMRIYITFQWSGKMNQSRLMLLQHTTTAATTTTTSTTPPPAALRREEPYRQTNDCTFQYGKKLM